MVDWQARQAGVERKDAVRVNELTDRQAEVLAYIKKYIKQFGYSPSLRAIAEPTLETIVTSAAVKVAE